VSDILFISNNKKLIEKWNDVLIPQYAVDIVESEQVDTPQLQKNSYSLVIVNSSLIEPNISSLNTIKDCNAKILVVGKQWPEENQLDALIAGASGYCESDVPPPLLLKTVEGVMNGDIWIQRHLISKVLDTLIQSNTLTADKAATDLDRKNLLDSLSKREFDVAKMISLGKSNKIIASTLFISERTVKAHLTSIFRKLGIPDRLHLAVMWKEIH
jgi:DNA-binding NarL/FixJ family response regulator